MILYKTTYENLCDRKERYVFGYYDMLDESEKILKENSLDVSLQFLKLKNNDYNFWECYLNKCINDIKFLTKQKQILRIDLHIHSNNSTDSDETLEEIIERTTKLGFNIISITDHDSVKVYDELYEYLKSNVLPIIIVPGVEFTIENIDYGNQFHVLQLFINPKSKEIINDIAYQENACKNRSIKQLYRLNHNKSIKYFTKKYNMKFNLEDYEKYLQTLKNPIYEYKTLIEYIKIQFDKNKISNWNVLKKMRFYNNRDKCLERKNKKIEIFNILENKYKSYVDSDYNFRFFHNLLAMKDMDDDFFKDYAMVGDLSVNSFGALKLEELNKNNLTIFAHPSENKLSLLNDLLLLNDNVSGMELNKRCKYSDINNFYDKLSELNMLLTKGSDAHDISSNLYDDMDFYNVDKKKIIDLIKKLGDKY